MPKTPTGPKIKHAPASTAKESKDASNQLRKGHSSAGRAMAAKSKATGKRR
jgi:hypothetical protein